MRASTPLVIQVVLFLCVSFAQYQLHRHDGLGCTQWYMIQYGMSGTSPALSKYSHTVG